MKLSFDFNADIWIKNVGKVFSGKVSLDWIRLSFHKTFLFIGDPVPKSLVCTQRRLKKLLTAEPTQRLTITVSRHNLNRDCE